LITGSSSGIGLETALALARDGYYTFASMRDTKKAAELEYAAKKEDLKIKVIELDVDKEESIISAIKNIMTDKGRVDVLVNNAGYGQFGCTEDVSVNDFQGSDFSSYATFQTHPHESVLDSLFIAAPSNRSTHWSIAWSDLMMTMFILFMVMFIYKAADKEFLSGQYTTDFVNKYMG